MYLLLKFIEIHIYMYKTNEIFTIKFTTEINFIRLISLSAARLF